MVEAVGAGRGGRGHVHPPGRRSACARGTNQYVPQATGRCGVIEGEGGRPIRREVHREGQAGGGRHVQSVNGAQALPGVAPVVSEVVLPLNTSVPMFASYPRGGGGDSERRCRCCYVPAIAAAGDVLNRERRIRRPASTSCLFYRPGWWTKSGSRAPHAQRPARERGRPSHRAGSGCERRPIVAGGRRRGTGGHRGAAHPDQQGGRRQQAGSASAGQVQQIIHSIAIPRHSPGITLVFAA